MKLRFAFAVLAAFALSSAARAAEPPAPWETAQAVLATTTTDFDAQGIRGVAPHIDDLEKALAGAKDAILAAHPATGTITVLTDGMADTIVAMAAASTATKQSNQSVVAVANPYPMISLLLGSYYDEIGRPDDAARVLDAGLAVYDMQGFIQMGEHRSWLMLERGAAANSMKDFAKTLAISDEGLAITGLPDDLRAHFYRNRGFALTELGRLDESEQAYRDSLKYAPGNETALGELQYLAKLKAGAPTSEGGLKPLSAPAPATTQ